VASGFSRKVEAEPDANGGGVGGKPFGFRERDGGRTDPVQGLAIDPLD
jgi:hypothetical protein